MKKGTVIVAGGLVLVCGFGGYTLMSSAAAAKAAQEAANVGQKTKPVRRDLVVSVIETGSIDASKVVEVKGRVTGRLAKLLVDEGDLVTAGQLIAVIDPQETQLRVQQDAAQLRGAESAVARSGIEIDQRKVTARANYEQASARVAQLKLELDAQPTVTRSLIRQAETNLNTAIQERDRLTNSAQPTQRVTAQSALAEAKANYANALRDFQRQTDLAEKGYVAGRVVDNAKLTLDLAQVRMDSAKETLDRLDSQLRAELAKANESVEQFRAALQTAKANAYVPESKRQEYLTAVAERDKAGAALHDPEVLARQRDQSLATVAQLRSVLNDSQRQLGETEIRAPISGVVTKKLIQVGELATGLSQFSSGSTIVKIEDRRSMRVKLDVNEIDMAKLRVGMKAQVDVDAIPTHVYHGLVEKIAPASKESATPSSSDSVVKYEVEIALIDADRQLRSGMSAKCRVDVIRRDKVLALPIEYIVRDNGKTYVELPPRDPKAKGAKPERRQVEIGIQTGALVEIVAGVWENEWIQKPKYTGPKRKGFIQAGPDDQ